jgi:hypothetical protein
LTLRFPPDSTEKLSGAVASAQVDLNPHQVDAALFAFKSPLSKGALLADEVGLGKTIEAGLVLSQKWAERKQWILVITPSNLRKQWYQELTEKFFLPCRILEAKSYNTAIKQGQFRPFEAPDIVICSYQFARSKAGDVNAVAWDLVVIDEAHRLRNVYKPSNVIANTLKLALAGKHKLLLTATPLQNSLLELFGLVSFIDEHTFGDLVIDSFAGSGTTGAVAQKMGRRWIMIEFGEQCDTLIAARLKKVVDGEDPGGITESVNWKGGGGFRYYRLAPSLLEKDKWGNWVINRNYNSGMLAEALCKLEGFTYAPSDSVYWQHGQSTERDFIYVTTAILTHEQLQNLSDEVGPDRTLLVLCTAFRAKADRYPNLTVKKIPKHVLSRCEWGHDNYSLRVENLPKAPPKPGQQVLFDEVRIQ